MRVMVTGSRDWEERTIIRAELAAVREPMPMTLVHGAARGADNIAADIALDLGYDVEPHPADWGRWGKAAGPIRNREMIKSGIDLVLAFCLGRSAGTRDAMRLAMQAGIPMISWDAEPGDYPGAKRYDNRALADRLADATSRATQGPKP